MRGDGPPSILMVDDDPHVLRSLRAALESHGYRVRSAPNGAIALESCAAERPDVVLLDLALPGLDGVDVCPRLRSWSRVPTLVLSVRQVPKPHRPLPGPLAYRDRRRPH